MPEGRPKGAARTSITANAIYLKTLRLLLDEAIEARRIWVRQLGLLMEEARTAHRSTIVLATGRTGVEQAGAFRSVRGRLERLEVPAASAGCHRAVMRWLDKMVLACEAMVQVGETGELAGLKDTQEQLAASRTDARRFNAEYERLMIELRRRVTSAGQTKRRRGIQLGRLLRRGSDTS